MISLNINEFHIPYNILKDQFAFVNNFNYQPGVIISFIGIKLNKEIVRFYYEDVKSLDEINKISAYKVSPIVN